jgi:hypothetical protein
MRLGCLAAAATAALAVAVPAQAHDHDFQYWTQLTAFGPVKGDFLGYLELQPRLWDNAARLGQLVVRPAVGYRITPDTNVLLGYAYVRTDPLGGIATDENRLWQQLIYPLLKMDGLTVLARSRLEQRTVVNAGSLGWRFRQQVRAQAPLSSGSRVLGVAWTEAFYNFNTTDWGAREGFDQVRAFVGVQLPLTDRLNVEPGYVNQTIFRLGRDRMNHILGIYLNYRL